MTVVHHFPVQLFGSHTSFLDKPLSFQSLFSDLLQTVLRLFLLHGVEQQRDIVVFLYQLINVFYFSVVIQ